MGLDGAHTAWGRAVGIEENDSWWTLPHTPRTCTQGTCSPRESHLEDVFNRLEWLEVGWGRL